MKLQKHDRAYVSVASVTALGVFSLLASDCPRQLPKPPEVKPKFDQFGVAPNPICTNLGVPMIRVSWKVKDSASGVETCLSNLAINGTGVDGNLWAVGVQGGRCGDGNYSRETAFDLRGVFGNNIPSQITVSADLTKTNQAGVFVGGEVLDSKTASTTARECEAGFVPGG